MESAEILGQNSLRLRTSFPIQNEKSLLHSILLNGCFQTNYLMELVRDSLLLILVILLAVTQTPQGQKLITDNSGSTLDAKISSIEKDTAKTRSNTEPIDTLLTESKFKSEDFAQEDTLTDVNSNTDQIETNTENVSTEQTLEKLQDDFRDSTGLFDGVEVNNRQNLFHTESTIPLNKRRNNWEGNTSWTGSTYQLNGTGYIRSSQRGEYQPGSTAEVGEMIIVEDKPSTGNEEMKWLYFNGENGFYFGVNKTCTFVGIEKNNETLSEVCQNNWNTNTVNTSKETNYNPSGRKLDLNDANMYQSHFAWYGAGIIELQVVFDDENRQETVTVHRFDIQNQTSLSEVSLPIKAEISNDDDGSTSLEVGGRQFAILDNYEPSVRQTKVFVETMTASASEYTPALSVKDLPDYDNVNLNLISFSATPVCDVNAMVRYNTVLTNEDFQDPSLIEGNETLIQVDKNATSWQNGTGTFTGQYISFAQLAAGEKKKAVTASRREEVSSVIAGNQITLAFKADDTSCDVTDITLQVSEDY